MKQILYSISARICLSLTAMICIYLVYVYAAGAKLPTSLLLTTALGLACGLGLLGEVRRLKKKERKKETEEQNI